MTNLCIIAFDLAETRIRTKAKRVHTISLFSIRHYSVLHKTIPKIGLFQFDYKRSDSTRAFISIKI